MTALGAGRHGRALLLVGGAGSAAVALAGGEMGGAVLRAAAVLGLLAAGAFWVRRARREGAPPTPDAVVLAARQELGRDAGVALLRAGGRDLLVGYGAAGVRLLAELSPPGGTCR